MIPSHCPHCKRRYTKSDRSKAFTKALRAGKAATIATRKQSMKEIRAAVMARANDTCEAFGLCSPVFRHGGGLQLDHWLSGSGRRKPRQSVKNTWALCYLCHTNRTLNYPSAAVWNEIFEKHCERHGYPVLQHVEHKQLPRRGTA